MLLSTVKRSGPRQSFDIDKYERMRVPRLPSLRLGTAPELDEDEEDPGLDVRHTEVRRDKGGDGDAEEEFYEGNSMTLADILLQAGHQGNVGAQLLQEDELEGEMSDWE